MQMLSDERQESSVCQQNEPGGEQAAVLQKLTGLNR